MKATEALLVTQAGHRIGGGGGQGLPEHGREGADAIGGDVRAVSKRPSGTVTSSATRTTRSAFVWKRS